MRAAAQQVLSRGPAGLGMRSGDRPTADAPRRTVDVNHHVHVGADQRPSRAFGAAAMNDEATLDIPAYLRRSRPAG